MERKVLHYSFKLEMHEEQCGDFRERDGTN